MESMPEELESLERRILQLEIEREALRKKRPGFQGTPSCAGKTAGGSKERPGCAQGAVGK